MNMEFTFSVIARCKVFEPDNKDQFDIRDITLPFNEATAASFLFKFGPDCFKIEDYKCQLKYNNAHVICGLILVDREGYTYVCTNFKQILQDIHNGYIRICTFNKINQIMEFDFEAGIDLQNPVEDEFE